MYEAFKARAEAVSAEVHRFTNRSEALEFILNFMKEEGVADHAGDYAVWVDSDFPDGAQRKRTAEQVPGLRFEVTRETAAAAKVGVSSVDWAVAETGTLVGDSTAIERRLASTLPPVHIALASTDRIVPDMAAVFARIDPKRCGYIAAITGPSRTADIERVLTIGVHGPKRLIIVFVDGPGTAEAR